ncbi:unnamed protein product [Brachionus calyciflorus]|uniref:C-type lectin domain-containing protein n=1 Tax=Brachionus calyciflorus TaxID=104777 RepID=A0A813M6B5_9BILA|nr:unnamed protein product [Brachionus calyciflorus]
MFHKSNSCKPCKPGFIKYSEIPFLCYHSQSEAKNLFASKSYCESLNGFLFRPKTKIERIFFAQKFPSKVAFVDSTITAAGQLYKWPDGSTAVGFDNGQPDYYLGIEFALMIRSNGYFNDVQFNDIFDLTILLVQVLAI